MVKFKNISVDEKMVLIDAGKKNSGEPYAQYTIVNPGQIIDIKNEALRGASQDRDLQMITEEVKTLPTNFPGVETKVIEKRRGRPPKTV